MINKKCSLIFILLLLSLMILPISFADDMSNINQADTLTIDDSSDIISAGEKNIYVAKNGSNSGSGSEDNPYGSLEKALEESTATANNIFIKEGIYNEYSLSIKSNVNIIGLGDVVIDADGAGPIFTDNLPNEVSIALKNITIKNVNTSDYGGVLQVKGYNPLVVANVTFEDMTFINCYSKKSGAVIYDYGGSQAHPKNNLNIVNSKFIGCSSPAGPVVYAKGNTNIINSTFINNKYLGTSASGSCIGFYGFSSGTVSGCIFENNTADSVRHESGAIYSSATYSVNGININNNVFIGNSNYQIAPTSANSAAKMNIENNWWGTNNPNATLLNRNINFTNYTVLDLTADPEVVDLDENSTIKATYYINGTKTQNNLIPQRNITLTATGGSLAVNKDTFAGEFTTEFSSSSIGHYTVTANVDNQELKTDVVVRNLDNRTAVVAKSNVDYKDVTISVTIAPSSATGNVTFTLNGKKEVILLENAKGSITLHNVPIGEYDNIVLTYNGDENHNPSTATISFMVFEKYPSDLSSSVSVNGSDVTVSVEVNPENATGDVTFTLNGNDETIHLNEGKGNITIKNIPNNEYEITLTYTGDDDYQTSTDVAKFNVLNRIPTELTINPVVDGDTVTIYAKLNETQATGNVTFTLRYKTQVINIENGQGNVSVYNVTNDVYNLTFTYNGDMDYNPSNATEKFIVSVRKDSILTAEASVNNQAVTIDADINYITASGNVTFTINGEDKIINITRSKGSITLENVPFGNYSVLLTYNGDINFNPSQYTLEFNVIDYEYGEILYVSKDGNDENKGSADDPLLTVSKAIYVVNNFPIVKKVIIKDGLYFDSNMTLERGIVIEGQSSENTIIDAQKGFIFEIYGLENNVSISNITFKNGYNANGGAIRDYGYSLNVTDCKFINNTGSDQGGAIYHYYGEAIIKDCEFIGNRAITGGAVYASSYIDMIEIDGCKFENNEALSGIYAGGAIYNAGPMIVNNSEFISNKAVSRSNLSYDISGGDGGAIYNANILIVENSNFVENRAYYWGGAIKTGGQSYIYYSNFTANSAGSRGGAVHSSGSGSYSEWTTYITGCNFDSNIIGNSAYDGSSLEGGAVCAEAPTAIRDSRFTNNYGYNGGALFMRSNAKYVDNCTFIDNDAVNGGAIYDDRTQSVISNSTFINNNATLGGAVLISGSRASSESGFTNLTENIYLNNSATNGGAIYSDAGYASPQELNIKYSEFANNTATGNGSVIYTTNRANIEYNAIIYGIKEYNVIDVAPECEGIVSLENNWWGLNSPDLTRIIRGITAPEIYAILNLTANPTSIEKNEQSNIIAALKWNDNTTDGIDLIPEREIDLSASIGSLTNDSGFISTEFTSQYSSDIAGTYEILASVDNELQSVSVTVIGDAEIKSIIYVNSSNGDDRSGDGSKDNPVKTIARAIALVEENGTIIMNGVFKGNGNTRLGIASSINNITFVGVNNTIIDGEHRYWIFSITDGTFTFANLTFQNAYYAGYGAAIRNQAGYLYVENCTFNDNVAQGSSAIDNTGYLVVIDSDFNRNIATVYDGGALSSSWEAYIINSTFTNNRAYQNGGAMKNYEEGYLYIEGCDFKDNIATGSSKGSYGGAVYSWASDAEIFLSNFTDNMANSKGGAIYASYGNSFYEWHAVVMMNEFEGNEAPIGSTLFLELVTGMAQYNAFLDGVVYTYGTNCPIDDNWWGVNNPDWSSVLSGTIKKPSTYAVLNVSANPSEISQGESSLISYEFFWNGTANNENVSYIPYRAINISSTGGELINTSGILTDAKFNTSFTSDVSDVYQITANVDNEVLVINVTVKGGVIITPNVKVDGDNVTIDVNVKPGDATGNISFEINGSTYVIDLINGTGNVTVSGLANGNYTVDLKYSGDETYPASTKTVEFAVDNKIETVISVNATVSEDSVTVNVEVIPSDASGNVTFDINGTEYSLALIDGKANITISNLTSGNYTFNVKYGGDENFNESTSDEITFTIKDDGLKIIAPDVTKYVSGPERFAVTVLDAQSNPVANKSISIVINGVSYSRTTDESGSASIALNLNSGVYNVTAIVDNTTINSVVTVLATVNGTELTKIVRNASQYYATFRDSQGNYLASGTEVTFNINGVMYHRTVGENGIAQLNINLDQGKYILTAINPVTNDMASNNIVVISKIVENHDLVKYFRNDSHYVVRILGDDGNPVGAGENVTFNINGVFYTRQTNESGYVQLNINIQAGEYIITTMYGGCVVANTITVKPTLTASDMTMHYRDGSQFKAKLVDGQGNPSSNEKIEFNINGVFYYRTTNSDGIASLNINLISGEYIITSKYEYAVIANIITVL